MRVAPGDVLGTWPFWAPSQAAAVEAALDLAEVGPGSRVVDLGCGDGQVLLAAATRGAQVAGIENDAALVDEATTNLRRAGVDAHVSTGDLFDPDLDLGPEGAVLFTYLAPATLQRLLPVVRDRRDLLVTVDFAVPGLVPHRRSDPARLYRLPGRRRPVPAPGWPSAGTLVATDPDCQALSCLDLVHPGGPVRLRLSRNLVGVVDAVTGADELDGPAHLAVDLRWDELDTGTVVGGWIDVSGVGRHELFVVVTEEDHGMWELTEGATAGLRRALRRRQPPTTLAALLAATGA